MSYGFARCVLLLSAVGFVIGCVVVVVAYSLAAKARELLATRPLAAEPLGANVGPDCLGVVALEGAGAAAGAVLGGGAGAGVVAAAAGDPVAEVHALLAGVGGAGANRLAQLGQERRNLQQQKKEVQKNIRNEQKKRKRTMVKAKSLSDADLLGVLAARAAQAKAKAKAKGKGKGKG